MVSSQLFTIAFLTSVVLLKLVVDAFPVANPVPSPVSSPVPLKSRDSVIQLIRAESVITTTASNSTSNVSSAISTSTPLSISIRDRKMALAYTVNDSANLGDIVSYHHEEHHSDENHESHFSVNFNFTWLFVILAIIVIVVIVLVVIFCCVIPMMMNNNNNRRRYSR